MEEQIFGKILCQANKTVKGLLREYDYGKGFCDVYMHSLLASEYMVSHNG